MKTETSDIIESIQSPIDENKGGADEDSPGVSQLPSHVDAETVTDEKKRKASDREEHNDGSTEKDNDDEKTKDSETKQEQGVELVKLSKNQMKKRRRLERAMEVKRKKKQQEKEAKIARAIEQGRDIEKERRLCEERRLEGEGKKRRQGKWEKKWLPLAEKSFQVCIDCSFESRMTSKEIKSLALQIRYCYAANKRNLKPCKLSATNVAGETMGHLRNVNGFEEWTTRAFTCIGTSLEEYYSSQMENVVYLTSDSEHVLNDLDDSKIYVIGGIVDRNRLKGAALHRAEDLGVTTAKLPIDEHLRKMAATRVLTCNHVFELLLKYREYGKDWLKALRDVLPQRKDAQLMDEDENTTTATKAEDKE